MESAADWSNILADIGYVILCKLPDFIDHVWFGAVCKNWYTIVEQYNQLTRPSRGTLPMYFIPVSECETQRRLICMPKCDLHPIATLSNIPPNKRCCGSSRSWLAFMEEDLSVTLINPFFNFKCIQLPVLTKTEATVPYEFTITKLILSPDSTPDSYTVVVIHGGMLQLAMIRSGDSKWTYIKGNKNFVQQKMGLSDIVFHKGLVYALDHQCKIFSINISSRSRPFKIIALNLKNLPRRNIVEEQYSNSYIVESTSGHDLYVLRRNLDEYGLTKLFRVLKLEQINGGKVRVVEVETLNGDSLFISKLYSVAVKASNFDWCEPNTIYFTDDSYIWNHPKNKVDDSGIYNVQDKSITRLKLCLRHVFQPNPFWVQPPFN